MMTAQKALVSARSYAMDSVWQAIIKEVQKGGTRVEAWRMRLDRLGLLKEIVEELRHNGYSVQVSQTMIIIDWSEAKSEQEAEVP